MIGPEIPPDEPPGFPVPPPGVEPNDPPGTTREIPPPQTMPEFEPYTAPEVWPDSEPPQSMSAAGDRRRPASRARVRTWFGGLVSRERSPSLATATRCCSD